MESIKSFLGNPYYLMTAVLAIAAFGFAATAGISLIQERKQKKEETQEEPLEKKLGVDTKKLKNVLNVPDLKRKKNIPVIEEEKTENAPEELSNDKEEVPVSNIDTEPEVLNPADVAEFKSRMIEHFRRKDTLQQSLLELQELYENGPILERIEKALTYSQRSRYRDFETMDGVTHSVPPALSDYLERHQQLNDTELGAKRLQKLNCDSKNVSYANALLSYVREARECLNSGKQLPQRPTRSSITLEKPNEEVAVPLSEQTPEETAVPDLNSAPEISIPSSNNEEVMQHQNTTPESPEAEHQQAKMENLMDISLPLVDQEPFQEILQALLKNDMSQAANLLQYLGSHLDKLQEEHQKMQVEFRELKEQVNSIDERFFNDSDSVDTVQNNLDQSEKLITLNKSRLANVVLQTKSKLKTAGKNALLSFAEKIHVPKALASLQKGMQHTQDSLDVLFQRLNDAKQAVQDVSNSVKNVGRALTGKELLEYVPWDPEKGKIASVQRKIYAMERTLGNLQERTNTLLSKMQRPEQKPEKQVKKTTKKL